MNKFGFSNGYLKRLKLFNEFSKNYQLVMDDDPDTVICPLCFTVFTKEYLHNHHKVHLTIEHAPAKKLGGKGIVLTCNTCNSNAGGLDSKLKGFKEIQAFREMAEGASTKAELNFACSMRTITDQGCFSCE